MRRNYAGVCSSEWYAECHATHDLAVSTIPLMAPHNIRNYKRESLANGNPVSLHHVIGKICPKRHSDPDTSGQAPVLLTLTKTRNMENSAGDKYETTRAMMQLEKEMHATQWNEALKLKKELEQLTLDRPTERIGPGSLVLTDSGRYFLAISLGFVKLGGTNYVVLSPASPLGMRLCGLAVGEEATFNKQRFHIQAIH